MKRPIEPGLIRIFRYFSGIAVVYFAILWIFAVFLTGFQNALQVQFFTNLIVYLGLLVYLTLPQVEHRLKHWFLPIGLSIATSSPVLANVAYLVNPSQADINVIINRSWLWLPVLFVPLVLIAWQYRFRVSIVYIIITNILELIVLLVFVQQITFEVLTIVSVPVIRAFAFGIVGYIVSTLMDTQRFQQQKLIQTNLRLSQYASTMEQLATSRERNRLATELHDTLAHTLSGLSINLEAIKTVVPASEEEAQEMLDRSLKITRSGLDETRRVLKALRAGPLEDLGLYAALNTLVKSTSDRLSIPVTFVFPENSLVLHTDVEQSIYRIVQEALENVIRHANARHAEVKLERLDNQMILTISDDGQGFDPDKIASEKFGLRGLKERAAVVEGKLTIQSGRDEGTTIRCVWELNHDQSIDL